MPCRAGGVEDIGLFLKAPGAVETKRYFAFRKSSGIVLGGHRR